MAKKNLGWFIVEKAGRIVDCVRAKDLCLAFQEAMEKWEPWCAKGTRIEVKPMPDAKPAPVIVKPTPAEVRNYAERKQPRNFNTWPYFVEPAVATENE